MPIRKASEMFGYLNVVMFSPDDLAVVKNGPAERRRFLDKEICQIDPVYMDDLGKYNTTFFYPMLMIQDIQVNYNFSKWSVGAGFKDIVSNSLSGNYWQVLLNAVYYL